MTVRELIEKLPEHKCGLYLSHNEHRDYYEPVATWLENYESMGGGPQWKDDEAKQRAIDTDECWVLQWYPETPIGCCQIAAPTLEEVLDLARESKE